MSTAFFVFENSFYFKSELSLKTVIFYDMLVKGVIFRGLEPIFFYNINFHYFISIAIWCLWSFYFSSVLSAKHVAK